MRLIRTSFVVVATVILLAMAVPAAQARVIEKPQASVNSQGGTWLAHALENATAWLARLAGNESPLMSRTMKSTTTTTTGFGGPHYIPQTGPCIDPMGNNIPRCGGI